ncbi:SusC/RagA family TonB-linked outer membrane protein [Sphingobacteriaceae bacterium WQ 2009]|uniref:SusC/RagA family TonB-linked outer membrane protein n=1 Tax=Rhinopithecimicrobium faecis TaxID=2820698 RepID=A0A8T4HD03_9SPHI|nr:SusC/RagA family TonB-linked outer membrane protein [Sphingobacteriaceae bacterium WQ 2009]
MQKNLLIKSRCTAILLFCLMQGQVSKSTAANHTLSTHTTYFPLVRINLPLQTQDTLSAWVVNERNQPLRGVSISNGQQIVITDNQGKFVVQDIGLPIKISFVGYKTQTLQTSQWPGKQIKLIPNEQEIAEVVVNGLFSRPKANFTGSSTTVKGADLKNINPSNLFRAISTIDPSFQLVTDNMAGGNINKTPEIQVRGQNSFPNLSGEVAQNPNQPLFILDGFEVNIERIMDLDMNMIAEITLLKDATATSVYGSRAANGVLIISTLLPEKGQLRVVVTNDFGISRPDLTDYNMMNAREKLQFEQSALVYSSNNPLIRQQLDELYNERLKAVAAGVNTNWLKIPVQTSYNNRTNVSVSGGDDIIRYALHGTANFQNGVMKGQNRTNYSGQFDLSYRKSKFQFANSLRIYQTKSNESPYGSFSEYVAMNPYWSPYDDQGNIKQVMDAEEVAQYAGSRKSNPLYNTRLNTIDRTGIFGFQNNLQLRYQVKPSLFFESQFSVSKEIETLDIFRPAQHTDFQQSADPLLKGSYIKGNKELLNYELNLLGNYNKIFLKHTLFSTLGFNMSSRNSDQYRIKTLGFGYDQLDHLLFSSQYEPNSKPSGDESTIHRISFLANLNYAYDNRYLVDFSIRRDGSSQFGTDERYGNFWSTGIGWNMHQESFLKDHTFINRLKLRAGIGATGSLNIPAYSSQTRYSYQGNYMYNGSQGANLVNIGNPNLGWQDKVQLNVGLDLVLWKEKVDLRFEHYIGTTNSTITPVSLAPSVGVNSYYENLGKIKNTGYELSLRYKAFERKEKGILWSIFLNAAQNKNKLIEISNSLKKSNDELNTGASSNSFQTIPNIQFREGESMNSIYVVRSLGINPVSGNELYLDNLGNPTTEWSSAYKVAVGTTDPRWRGSFGSSFLYKGFDIAVIVDYRFGGQLYNATLVNKIENADVYMNVDRRAFELGWQQPGDIAPYRYVSIYNGRLNSRVSSRFVQDDNTLQLNSVSVGYTFLRQAFMSRWNLQSLKLTATANDLFRKSSIHIERGLDNPFARNFMISLRASF